MRGFRRFGEPFKPFGREFGAGAGAAVLSLPSTNRLAWWNANRDVYSDTGLTALATDGGTVGGWKDQNDTNHVTQGTAGDRPVYRAGVAALNNKPAIEFVSSDFLIKTGMAAGLVANLNVYSIYVVFATTSGSLITPYSEGNSGAATPFVTTNVNAAQVTYSHRDGVGTIASGGGGAAANNGAKHLITVRRIASNSWAMRLDGVEVNTSSNAPGSTSINQVAIGTFARVTNTQFFVGHIAQVALYNADNYTVIEPLLAREYGINLP